MVDKLKGFFLSLRKIQIGPVSITNKLLTLCNLSLYYLGGRGGYTNIWGLVFL